MSLDTYANLQTEIGEFLSRSDLTAKIPSFITLLEARAFRKLKLRDDIVRGSFSISSQYTDLDTEISGWLELIDIELNTEPVRPLQILSPDQKDFLYSRTTTGKPHHYAIHGNELEVYPSPDATYTCNVTYRSRITNLSDANTTNWLLTNHPDIYLYGSLVAAESYILNDARLPMWKALLDEAMRELNLLEKRATHSGSALKQVTRTGNP